MNNIWSDLHKNYKDQGWIDKPSLFAQTAIQYFPANSKVLDLGAGQGQDSRYFANNGHQVISTDIEESALEASRAKLTDDIKPRVALQQVDLRQELPFDSNAFDVVYAHLSIHYFDYDTTVRLIGEIQRVLKPGGIFAFLANSVNDPEYGTGAKLEDDYFRIAQNPKRYFSLESTRKLMQYYDTILLDNHGETYKDAEKGVHNLIRYIGSKRAKHEYSMLIPYCAAIIERQNNGCKEVLIQTRWKVHADPVYSGTLEFPAGALDKPFEDIHATIAREIKEECGLTLKTIKNDNRTPVIDTGKNDAVIGFRPYCCTQQLKNGKPFIGFVFICEVEPGEPKSQISEAKDAKWVKTDELRQLYETSPSSFFALELPAWKYYFEDNN